MNNLKKYRCENNYTQTEFANEMGISKSAVSVFERPNTKSKLSKNIAEKAAKLFNCSVVEVLGWENFARVPQTREEKLYLINLLQSSLND